MSDPILVQKEILKQPLEVRLWTGLEMVDQPVLIPPKDVPNPAIALNAHFAAMAAHYLLFTGIYDRNGQKVFEGHIVQVMNEFGTMPIGTGEIIFQRANCLTCMHFTVRMADGQILQHIHGDQINVIGDIYRHRNLLI